MSNFTNNILNNLLGIYDKVMVLRLFLDDDDDNLKTEYINAANTHNSKLLNFPRHIDAGFDLFTPGNKGSELRYYGTDKRFFGPGWDDRPNPPVNKLNYRVKCAAQMYTDTGKTYNTGYYMYPRSSLSKTPLRLANCTGIIDAGYRGNLTGMFDLINLPDNLSDSREADYYGKKLDRYVQICAPGLVPIIVEIVESLEELGEETQRGGGGFGSTGR